jgi:hypothetical protein
VLLTSFDGVYLFDGVEVDGVHGKAVEGVGWHSDKLACPQTGDDVLDPVWLWFIRVNS